MIMIDKLPIFYHNIGLRIMKPVVYKILFYLLKGLISIKRAVFWLGKQVINGFRFLFSLFNRTIGFRFYKIGFRLQRIFGKVHIPWDSRLQEVVGKRSFLQVAFFIAILIILIPQSRLSAINNNKIAGRDTLLYGLVGPGDQDFSLEEVNMDFTYNAPKETYSWKEGAVVVNPSTISNVNNLSEQDISAITAGGTAVSKPNIAPGASVSSGSTSVSSGRQEVISYQVQNGDTIGGIASKFGISVNTILWANGLTSRSYIRPGDTLKILPASGLLHKVARGDTIGKIASKYQAKAEDIIKANNLQENGADIVVGEELIIPGGVKPATYTSTASSNNSYKPLSNVTAPSPSVDTPAGSGYLWPAGVRRITQYYGWRHTGLDIAGPVGTPLYASKSGTVKISQCGWNGGYGCYIILDHGGGVQTLYGHASQLYVSAGDSVSQGQTIAAMGSTGRSTGPHIHFEVRINGARLNPLKYIR